MNVSLYARAYRKAGLSIFPLDPGSKRPFGAERGRAMKWEHYQRAIASENEIAGWWAPLYDGRVPNIAIVGGAVSGNLAVLDFDDLELFARFTALYPGIVQATKIARTGKGFHVYLRTDEPMHKGYAIVPGKFDATGLPIRLGLDLQAEEAYVVAPPSLHESGARYEWANPSVRRIGQTTVEMVRSVAEKLGGRWTRSVLGKAAEGLPAASGGHPWGWISTLLLAGPSMVDGSGRNRSLTALMGYFRSHLPLDLGYALAELWNNSCAEPMDESEVRTIVHSVYRYNAETGQVPDQDYEDLPV